MSKTENLNDDIITSAGGEIVPRNSDLQSVLDRASSAPCPGIGMHTWEDRRAIEGTEQFSCTKCPVFLGPQDLEKIRATADPADSAVVDMAKAQAKGQLKAAHYQAEAAAVYEDDKKKG